MQLSLLTQEDLQMSIKSHLSWIFVLTSTVVYQF